MAVAGVANDAAFDYFSCQSTTVLCKYLRERGISIDGRRKRDIVKLCVWAHQENLDIETGDANFNFKKDHDDRLLVGLRQLPEPLSITNWVHKVEYNSEESYCFVKGKCTPETRLSASPYDMWILMDKNGVMYSAECTCPAGDGSCKHVVAMLLGLEEILKEKGPTEAPMTWHKPKQVGCVPQEIKHLNFKPQAKTPQPHYTYFNPGMRNPTKELDDMFVSMVLESGENCIGLTSL